MTDLQVIPDKLTEGFGLSTQGLTIKLDGLPIAERKEAIKDNLSTMVKASDKMKLVTGAWLCEVDTNKYWADWGFQSFRKYLLTLDIPERKAYQLTQVYRIYAELAQIPMETLQDLSWSKAYICRSKVEEDPKNWQPVVQAINTLTTDQLKDWIKMGKPRDSESKHRFTCVLDDDNYTLLEAALGWVEDNTGSKSPSNAMSIFVQDFLATRPSALPGDTDNLQSLARVLQAIQTTYGVTLEVSDVPETMENAIEGNAAERVVIDQVDPFDD